MILQDLIREITFFKFTRQNISQEYNLFCEILYEFYGVQIHIVIERTLLLV
jgi:hypothetical protein